MKISVIIPVFNIESFVTRCLDSIIKQTYNNWEAIIVDDGSGIIPKAYISDGSEVTLKEVERKEEDPDDGNEYIGYVNKAEAV